MPVSDLIAAAAFDLRNLHKAQFSDPEMLAYFNRSARVCHDILVTAGMEIAGADESFLVSVPGQARYPLASHGMEDLVSVEAVWRTGFSELSQITVADSRRVIMNGEPRGWYLDGATIGLCPTPAMSHLYNVRYFRRWEDRAEGDETPFYGVLDAPLIEAMIVLGKNRNESQIPVDAALQELFTRTAGALIRRRNGGSFSIAPRRTVFPERI